MIMGAFLLPSIISSVAFLINLIAIYYHASRAIPFTIMIAVTAICLFVILPLTLVGTVLGLFFILHSLSLFMLYIWYSIYDILGRNVKGQGDYPCRVNAVPRPITDKKWFLEPWFIIMLGGILPFGSIFIEMFVIDQFFDLL